MIVLAAFFVALVSRASSQVLKSPCPLVLEYNELLRDTWFAKITFPSAQQRWSTIDIVLDRKARHLGSWLGQVTTQDSLVFRITNQEPNGSFNDSFKIFVAYDPSAGSPQVLEIKLDQQEICDVSNKQSTDQPPTTASEEQDNDVVQCGMAKLNQQESVSEGEILEGQWPWQTAIYKIRGANLQYYCGGTLVSRRHVITSAQCLIVPGSVPPALEDVKIMMAYLGIHNLAASFEGVVIKYVEKMFTHPHDEGIRKDLGILQFRDPVQYSNWVQPACLWPDLISELDRVVGKSGAVAGWEFTGSGKLQLSQMNIVSQLTCLRSNPNVFSRITSRYTFCARLANETMATSCVGVSGNGLMIRINGAWHLHGLASLSVSSEKDKKTCDLNEYMVFTDIAQFLPWIKNNIEPY